MYPLGRRLVVLLSPSRRRCQRYYGLRPSGSSSVVAFASVVIGVVVVNLGLLFVSAVDVLAVFVVVLSSSSLSSSSSSSSWSLPSPCPSFQLSSSQSLSSQPSPPSSSANAFGFALMYVVAVGAARCHSQCPSQPAQEEFRDIVEDVTWVEGSAEARFWRRVSVAGRPCTSEGEVMSPAHAAIHRLTGRSHDGGAEDRNLCRRSGSLTSGALSANINRLFLMAHAISRTCFPHESHHRTWPENEASGARPLVFDVSKLQEETRKFDSLPQRCCRRRLHASLHIASVGVVTACTLLLPTISLLP